MKQETSRASRSEELRSASIRRSNISTSRSRVIHKLLDVPSLESLGELRGKKILLRLDLNLTDLSPEMLKHPRVAQARETLWELLSRGAKVVALSHFSRDDNPVQMSEITELLQKGDNRLKGKLHFVRLSRKELLDPVEQQIPYFERIGRKLKRLSEGEALIVENVRLFPLERKRNKELESAIAQSFDYAVHDGFGVSHRREQFSSDKVFRQFSITEKAIGTQSIYEWEQALQFVRGARNAGIALIFGGSPGKFADKLSLLKKLVSSKKIGCVYLGGIFGTAFLRGSGSLLGQTPTETDLGLCSELVKLVRTHSSIKFLLPDSYVGLLGEKSTTWQVDKSKAHPKLLLPENAIALDQTPIDISNILDSSISRVLVAGPLGYYPKKAFRAGTVETHASVLKWAERDSQRRVIFAGGDSLTAVLGDSRFFIPAENVHLSSGGGAMMEAITVLLSPDETLRFASLEALRN